MKYTAWILSNENGMAKQYIEECHRKKQEPDFTHALLKGADLSDADLLGINFTGADLTYANLHNATLPNVILTNAVLQFADLTEAVFNGSVLTETVLIGADLTDAVMVNVVLDGANLCGAICTRTNFTGATLRKANLSCTSLQKTIFTDASLAGANLNYAILYYTVLSGADLSQIVMNWDSLELIAERLKLAAGQSKYSKVADKMLSKRNYGWKWFEANLKSSEIEWCLNEMRGWVKLHDKLPAVLINAMMRGPYANPLSR